MDKNFAGGGKKKEQQAQVVDRELEATHKHTRTHVPVSYTHLTLPTIPLV